MLCQVFFSYPAGFLPWFGIGRFGGVNSERVGCDGFRQPFLQPQTQTFFKKARQAETSPSGLPPLETPQALITFARRFAKTSKEVRSSGFSTCQTSKTSFVDT